MACTPNQLLGATESEQLGHAPSCVILKSGISLTGSNLEFKSYIAQLCEVNTLRNTICSDIVCASLLLIGKEKALV